MLFRSEAVVWIIHWGFFLRWIVFSRMRAGLDGDIHSLVARLPEARLADPVLADFAAAAAATARFLEEADGFGRDCDTLVARLAEPSGDLGRLVGGGVHPGPAFAPVNPQAARGSADAAGGLSRGAGS